MASIPLPALHVNPPEPPPNPLELAARVMQIKSAQQAQQLQQGQLQIQQQQIKDQKAHTAALTQWNSKEDPNGDSIPDLILKNGGSGDAAFSMKKLLLQQKSEALDLVAKQGAEAKRQADLTLGARDTVNKANPQDRPAVYQQQLEGLKAQGVDTSKMPQQYPGDEAFKAIGNVVQLHSLQVDDALKTSEQQKNTAQAGEATARAGEATAQTNKINAEINPNNPADPNIRKQKYEGILVSIQKGGLSSIPPADLEFARSYELGQRKTTTQADSLGVTSTNTSTPSGVAGAAAMSGKGGARPAVAGPDAPAAPSPPGGGSAQTLGNSWVDLIGQYKASPQIMNRLIVKHPEILAQVNQKYPDWSQPNYNSINKAITDLAPSGKTGQQITSYNTFLRHAGALYDAVDKLDNSTSSDLINKPLNWLAQHTGDPRVADFMAAMQPPMKEFQSFLLNNHAMHEEDVKDAHSLIDQNKTPQEIKAVLKRFAETGSARLSEVNESFKRVTQRDIPNLVSPQAAAAYNKITAEAKVIYARDPQGKLHQAPAGTPLPQGWTQENK